MGLESHIPYRLYILHCVVAEAVCYPAFHAAGTMMMYMSFLRAQTVLRCLKDCWAVVV